MEIVKPENLAVEGVGPTDHPQAEFPMPTGRVGTPISVAHTSGLPAFPGSNSSLLMGNSSMSSTIGRNTTSASMSGGMNGTHSVAGNGSFSMNGTHGGEGGVRFTTTLPANNSTSTTTSTSASAESTTLSSSTTSASSTTLTSSQAATTAISTTMTSTESESAKSTTFSSSTSSSLSAGSSPSSTSTAGIPKYPGRATWFRSSSFFFFLLLWSEQSHWRTDWYLVSRCVLGQHLTSCRTVTEDTDLVAALQHELVSLLFRSLVMELKVNNDAVILYSMERMERFRPFAVPKSTCECEFIFFRSLPSLRLVIAPSPGLTQNCQQIQSGFWNEYHCNSSRWLHGMRRRNGLRFERDSFPGSRGFGCWSTWGTDPFLLTSLSDCLIEIDWFGRLKLQIQWSFVNPADVLKMPANTSFIATTSTTNRTTDFNGYETRVIEEGGLERRGERVERVKVNL